MSELTILPAEEESDRIREEVPRVIEAATALEVATPADASRAAAMLDEIDRRLPKIDEVFDPNIRRISEALKGARSDKAALRDPLVAAREILNGKLATWRTEQARLIREQQAEAQKAIQEAADEAALREAEKLEAEGDTAGAQRVLEEAGQVAAPPVAPGVAAPAGRTFRTRWVVATDAEGRPLIDVDVLRMHAPDLMIPDMKAIGALTRARKRIPGVQVREVTDVARSAHRAGAAAKSEEVW